MTAPLPTASAATIFALSSGVPPAAIAIVRVSGQNAIAAAEALAGALPSPRHAGLRTLTSPDGRVLDRALVLVFPRSGSATGEDLVEFHLHGGRAVVAAVEGSLAALPGLRRAEPGEFTRRALAAGRIDLAEAEGLGDLLMAETEMQRRAALANAEGALSQRVSDWAHRLLTLSAQVEAALDFADEDDVNAAGVPAFAGDAATLAAEIDATVANPPVERLRDGIRIVLAGPPNSGKSTLLNALVEREAAIVSPISGTTRDRIEAAVTRRGVAYLLTDTAGLVAASADPIERIGITRAEEAIAAADIVVWLGDDTPPPGALWLQARADVPGRDQLPTGRALAVSAATGAGMMALWDAIAARAAALLPRLDRPVLNARQRDLCASAAAALHEAAGARDPLVMAELCRQARGALDRVTGAVAVEDMLDSLFSRFCIGK